MFDTTVKNKRVREALELRVGGSCGEHRETYVAQSGRVRIVNGELQKLELSADTLRETRVRRSTITPSSGSRA